MILLGVKDMRTYEIQGWCAGIKVSLREGREILYHPPHLKCDREYYNRWQKDIIKTVAKREGSVAVVSVNTSEKYLISFLRKYKWKPGPLMKNWIHNGRNTRLYFFQIPKKEYDNVELNW